MLQDHIERYEEEKFVCPAAKLLQPAEQLEILRGHEDQCLLHLSERQEAMASWHYNGRFPASKQFDAKEHAPIEQHSLLKLLKVSPSDGKHQVEYGRRCTVQEWRDHPRFCRNPVIGEQ